MKTNVLYYGDNLDMLRHHDYFPDASVDLVYLDPPFNSNRSYNILFRESSGAASEAQIEAFEDTWKWGPIAAKTYEAVVTGPHQKVARMLRAMVDGLGHNDVTAYLAMMAARLIELHRVLRPTGSIYLHCDPTAGHYLKALLDAIFGPKQFRNQISWKRTSAHNDPRRYGNIQDFLLFYSKGDEYVFNRQFMPYSEGYLKREFRQDSTGRWYKAEDLTAPNHGSPNRQYEWRGRKPSPSREWRLSFDEMERLFSEGRIKIGKDGRPLLRGHMVYLDEKLGTPLQDVWTDVLRVGNTAKERLGYPTQKPLGYPTQKPLALLERIIQASSNPGDIVLDSFCGCGTAVAAAQKLGRQWIGIDVTYLAINLIERRLKDAFPGIQLEVIGDPKDFNSARDLAHRDKWQFQWWALAKLDAQPVAGKKKGADRGIDGVIPFFAGPKEHVLSRVEGDYRRAIVSVKGGEHVTVTMVRDLVGILDREKEPIGILLTLEPPTQPMITEAAAAGIYHNELWQKDYPRVQIITVEEMLSGRRPQLPSSRSPYAQAQRIGAEGRQLGLEG